VGTILDLALDALLEKLDKAEFAATSKPRAQKSVPKPGKRHIPRWVKRAVRERDGGQCTYVSADGRRCTKRTHLEYDHVVEFARGGESTVENLRLRCRGHNQLTAEQTYGAGFMHQKRTAGQERRSPSPCQPG
jgi:5-methylcytosine-specific restriction endonuclease McrA